MFPRFVNARDMFLKPSLQRKVQALLESRASVLIATGELRCPYIRERMHLDLVVIQFHYIAYRPHDYRSRGLLSDGRRRSRLHCLSACSLPDSKQIPRPQMEMSRGTIAPWVTIDEHTARRLIVSGEHQYRSFS